MIARLPIRTVSEANVREHWAVKAKRARQQRLVAYSLVSDMFLRKRPFLAARVTFTRVGVRPLDTDNLARSMKAVRDGVADALGVTDAPGVVEWTYRQRRGKPREYAVVVEIEGTDF